MRTSKPFSTIDYNSIEFLINKLNDLIDNSCLDFWAFIEHLPEDDETKKHKHLFCIPSKMFDTNQLHDFLLEYEEGLLNTKPLTCITCKSSKFDDWLLYSLHNEKYLSMKGQIRKYKYNIDELICSDTDYLNELLHSVDYSKINRVQFIIDAVANNISFMDLVVSGQIPLNMFNQSKQLYEYIYSSYHKNITYRNGNIGHE